jgi:hypothetical protein
VCAEVSTILGLLPNALCRIALFHIRSKDNRNIRIKLIGYFSSKQQNILSLWGEKEGSSLFLGGRK